VQTGCGVHKKECYCNGITKRQCQPAEPTGLGKCYFAVKVLLNDSFMCDGNKECVQCWRWDLPKIPCAPVPTERVSTNVESSQSQSWQQSPSPGRMARGGHGLPKVSLRLAMPYPSMPCGWAIPETAFQAGQPLAVFYPFRHPTPYVYDNH
jgi:hypothetical protein